MGHTAEMFDWGLAACAEVTDDRVELRSERSSWSLRRWTPLGPTLWWLGAYLAEGQKTGFQASITNGYRRFLADVASFLIDLWGVPQQRLFFEPLYGDEGSFSGAYALCANLGVQEIRRPQYRGDARRDRSGRRNSATLIFHASSRVQTLLAEAIASVRAIADPMLLRSFVIGYAEGDGTITTTPTETSIRFSGPEAETRWIERTMIAAWGWTKRSRKYEASAAATRLTLRVDEMLDLATAGIFACSMTRARLLFAIERRLQTLRDPRHRGLATRYGYRDARGEPNDHFHQVMDQWASIEDEVRRLRNLLGPGHDGRTHRKCVPYPLESMDPPRIAHQRRIRDQRAGSWSGEPVDAVARCAVEPIAADEARPLIEAYEWLGTMGTCAAVYGLIVDRTPHPSAFRLRDGRELIGAITLGPGPGFSRR